MSQDDSGSTLPLDEGDGGGEDPYGGSTDEEGEPMETGEVGTRISNVLHVQPVHVHIPFLASRVSAHLRVSAHPILMTLHGCCDYQDRILSNKRSSPYKRSPSYDDPMRYTYKWLLRVNAHPRFLAVNFKRPWALNRETRYLKPTNRHPWNHSQTAH